MTQSVPNGFSMDELEAMLATAKSEDQDSTPDLEGSHSEEDLTSEQIEEFAAKCLDEAAEYSRGPVIHKVMALISLHRFIEWHTAMGEDAMKEGDIKCGTAWLRDAGQLQSVFNGLINISFGSADFTFNRDESSDN